jgi:hypothetical protein
MSFAVGMTLSPNGRPTSCTRTSGLSARSCRAGVGYDTFVARYCITVQPQSRDDRPPQQADRVEPADQRALRPPGEKQDVQKISPAVIVDTPAGQHRRLLCRRKAYAGLARA